MQIVAERAVASSGLPHTTMLEAISTEDLPLQGTIPLVLPAAPSAHSTTSGSGMPSSQSPLASPAVSPGSLGMGGTHGGVAPASGILAVDILEAVRQSMQTYEALYIGSLPVPRAMGKRCWPCRSWGMPENPLPRDGQTAVPWCRTVPACGAGQQHPACTRPAAGAGDEGMMGWGLLLPRDGCAERGHREADERPRAGALDALPHPCVRYGHEGAPRAGGEGDGEVQLKRAPCCHQVETGDPHGGPSVPVEGTW